MRKNPNRIIQSEKKIVVGENKYWQEKFVWQVTTSWTWKVVTVMGRNEEGNVRTMVRWCDDGRDRRKKGWEKKSS